MVVAEQYSSGTEVPSFVPLLLSRFMVLVGVRKAGGSMSMDPASKQKACEAEAQGLLSTSASSIPSMLDSSAQSGGILFEAFRILCLCRYSKEDIEVIAAHASVYLQRLERTSLPGMSLEQTIYTLGVLIVLGHIHVEDETCPVKVWHDYLFRDYCDVGTMNDAMLRIMERLNFRLRLTEAELACHVARLRRGDDDVKDGDAEAACADGEKVAASEADTESTVDSVEDLEKSRSSSWSWSDLDAEDFSTTSSPGDPTSPKSAGSVSEAASFVFMGDDFV